MASQLTITLAGGAGTVVKQISSALQALDSGQNASSQTGFSAVDVLIANICKRGGVWDDAKKTFYPLSAIANITWS